jgi:hypothetical protein
VAHGASSQPWAWRPAAVARLARTLGITKTMRLLALSLLCALSLKAHAVTDWERWLNRPTASSAQKVRAIEYTGSMSENEIGTRITDDLQTLAKRVHAGDPASLQLALRLTETTNPGANLEDLHEMIGATVRSHAVQLLRAMKKVPRLTGCPGAGFLGPKFVDQREKRERELAARIKALEDVAEPSLASEREKCLAAAKGDA